MRNLKRIIATIILGTVLLANVVELGLAASSLTGRLEMLWGSGGDIQSEQFIRTWLVKLNGEKIELFFTQGKAGDIPQEWLGKQVEVRGSYKALAYAKQGFSVEEIELRDAGALGIASTYSGNTPWVTLLCKFKDVPDEPKPASYFSDMYWSGYPRLVSYWKEVSYNLIDVSNSTAVSVWNVLPQNQEYYVYDLNGDGKVDVDFNRLNQDCINLVDLIVDFRNFKVSNLCLTLAWTILPGAVIRPLIWMGNCACGWPHGCPIGDIKT